MVRRPGSKYLAAGALFRLITDEMDYTPLEDEIPTFSALLVAAVEEEDELWLPCSSVFHTTDVLPQPLLHPAIPELLAIAKT